MPPSNLVLPTSVRSFSDYFDLSPDFEAVADALGYPLTNVAMTLPRAETPEWVDALEQRTRTALPYIHGGSEAARREIYIAPLFIELAGRYGVELRIEKQISVTESLRGWLDYLLEYKEQLLIVEAKRDDLDRGMSQLVAELVTVHQWAGVNSDSDLVYGAITTGSIWQFCVLHRAEKRIERDVALYRNPQDLHEILAILMGILRVG